ncbi:MAG: hypothetical protein WCN88_04075 [Candidatus Falkowbacteria bacterium]
MKSSLNLSKKSAKGTSRKIAIFLLVFIMLFSFLSTPVRKANAQLLTVDTLGAALQVKGSIMTKVATALKYLWQKSGSATFQSVARTALNKIAYDTATYLGSGDKGQKPLFITQDWGAYLGQIGDEAAGQFIETFANNLATSEANGVKRTECQNTYQECDKVCWSTMEDLTKLTDQMTTDFSACSQKCKTDATACDANVDKLTSGSSGSTKIGTAGVPTLNVCQPSSLQAKVKIGLGLVQYQRATDSNCTATKMIENWGDEVQRYEDMKNTDFLQTFAGFFNPTANDLGIYMSANEGMLAKQTIADQNSRLNLAANKGWLGKTNAAKELIGVPGDAEAKRDLAGNLMGAGLGKVTGDIVVDAANVFLNQYAITKFNDLLSKIGQKSAGTPDVQNPGSDPTVSYGEGTVKEVSSSIIKPNFGVEADYDILSQLTICSDPKNPGPTNCVIDNKFAQAISEKKTVAEAIKDGYIHGDWKISKDTVDNTYSLRNISILRKYRILPIGWEDAVNKASSNAKTVNKMPTVSDLVSCFSASDSYNQFSADFDTHNQAWCRGLVDPNWVLKASLNYCRKQGVSAQILDTSILASIPGISGNPYTPSALTVTRAEDYCADEQTCIKEKDDGSCDVYGYCNEEKRTWNFSGDSCEPIFNTCQSFTNPVSGKKVSYLENTLNYSGCNPESAGCRQYSTNGNYSTSTGTVSWDTNKSIYLNKNLGACNGKDEGCTELLRVKPTWGSNLVMNTDFASDVIGNSATGTAKLNEWTYLSSANTINNTRAATIVDATQEPGGSAGKALKLVATRTAGNAAYAVVGTFSDPNNSLLPENFQLISGQSYTVSADVYLAEGHAVSIYQGDTADGFVSSTATLNSWQHLTVTRIASGVYSQASFGINADTATANVRVYVKNIKFEVSNFDTGYNIYGAYRVYEKIIPPYLEAACYVNVGGATKDYRLKSDAPAACAKYARKCNREEVGCELYTGVSNGLAVSAQVTSTDYCPNQCLGYDIYISKEDHFNSPQSENIIPTTATACSAEAAGCSEFTNLDQVNQGGENKEYYTSLKQCITPSTTSCGSFYSWEGVESGYQLRSYSLQRTAQFEPMVTSVDSSLCNATIYSKSLGDPLYNPDCREFYNSAGQISYHLISRTITCSDNCHAYRMSQKNVDKTLTMAQCLANPTNPPTKNWDVAASVCNVCLNGGAWDTQLSACVYKAIPGEGKTCTASENGCREYNGNSGNNVKMLSYYDYESGAQSWTSNCVGGLQLSTIANNKNGHSMLYKDVANSCGAIADDTQSAPVSKKPLITQVFASANVVAQLNVSNIVSEGKSYTLRFIAKADVATNPQIYFYNGDTSNPQKAEFATSTLVIKDGGEWNIYQTNLDNLDHAITANEHLVISANHDFYFDDVVLTEITDRYYLIGGTSQIPDICYYDMTDKFQGEEYNLGCSQYTDRGNLKHNLRKFSKLCSGSAVGCEQMLATQNYTPYGSGLWNDTNSNGVCDSGETDCVKVERDEAIYAVYDANKQCNSADLGCSLLGQSVNGTNAWSDVYKKNNPNLYDNTLCGQAEVGCEEWKESDATYSYFRDPGNETCQYRASQDLTVTGKAWYKIPVKRCDADSNSKIEGTEKTGKICSSVNDCSNKPCIIDTNDYLCSTSYLKTFGPGGAGNQIPTPDLQAGLCDATASGCTEYIDPVSQFAPNIIFNPSSEIGSNGAEGWSTAGAQTVTISANQVYVFSTRNNTNAATTTLTFVGNVKELLNNNTLATSTTVISIPGNTNRSRMFFSMNNSSVIVSGGGSTEGANKTIELKTAIVGYQLKENIDKNSCNGVVNLDNGCVLFNERSISGSSGLADLSNKYNAQTSLSGQAPVLCVASSTGSCNANQLIKVSPNRVCSKWLDCLTYTQDPVTQERTCFAVGECTRLNDKNECISFEDAPTGTMTYNASGQNKNATGYYLLNKYHLSNMSEVGINTDAHYDFEDSVPAISCRRADNGSACVFSKNIITDLLVREPEKAPNDYPAHGASYVRVPGAYLVSPQSSNSWTTVIPNKQYFINFLVNTKNSGMGAVLIMKMPGAGKSEIAIPNATQSFYSNNGWTRQIFSFNPGVATSVKIYLGATDTTSDRQVYFDDINIEPVLEVNANSSSTKQYIARECRLYPTNDSLTCVNKNNNVLKDGWEGYCLEHDPNNKDVCLMWYPVDEISSSMTTRNSSGYQGKFPLNYCTELNGNFDLVEKRKTILIGADDTLGSCSNSSTDNGFNESQSNTNCATDYVMFYYEYNHQVGGHDHCNGNTWCIPRRPGLAVTVMEGEINRGTFTLNSGSNGALISEQTRTSGGADEPSRDVVTNSDGWYRYNGYAKNNSQHTCGSNDCTILNEETNADPAVRVLDYGQAPADEDGLKLISGNDEDKIFRLTCNRFVQAVDNNGDNKAWAARTSINSIWTTSTPPFFIDYAQAGISYYGPGIRTTHSIAAYGRNRQDVPFGAALWPDDFSLYNSEAIKFRNQYSVKNSENILAGRPYGCSNYNTPSEIGNGCSKIGYCSLDPSVYCLFGTATSTDYVARKTCADGGYGTCVPLWNNYLGRTDVNTNVGPDFENILSQLFLKSYNTYSFTNGAYVPGGTGIDRNPNTCATPSRPVDTYATTPAGIVNNFCAINPKIGSRVVVKYNNQVIATTSSFFIPKKGVYSLEFNTIIDAEQQPLKDIYIKWGANESDQLITGQDSRPNQDSPHVFYHYYKNTGNNTITIKIHDNWDKEGGY